MQPTDPIDRFYKKAVPGRHAHGNLFTRVEWLENEIKRLVGKDLTNFVMNIVSPPNVIPVPDVIDNSDYWKNVFVFDDFVTGTIQPTLLIAIGELGWGIGQDSDLDIAPVIIVSPYIHPGVYKIGNLVNTDGYLILPVLPNVNNVDLIQFVAIFEAPLVSGDGYAFGLMADVTTGGGFEADGTVPGVYFKCEYGDDNWWAVTTEGVSTTSYETTIPFDATGWHLFEIKRTAADTFEFYIDRVLASTHLSDLDLVAPIFGVTNAGSPGDISIYIDYFGMQLSPISQRWD